MRLTTTVSIIFFLHIMYPIITSATVLPAISDEMHLTFVGDQAFLKDSKSTPEGEREEVTVPPVARKSAALRKKPSTPRSERPRIWTRATVPYFFHSFSSPRAVRKIRSAMNEISAKTCIKFVPVTKLIKRVNGKEVVPPHVQIFQGRDNECWSVYGTHDVHPVSLSRGCWDRGTILHELMHVIGFEHSHTRPDRDKFIKVHWDNIDPRDWDEFVIRDESIEAGLAHKFPFDYESIMMYGELNGSRDEESPVLSRRDGKRLIDLEDKKRLSKLDVKLVNKVYKCRRR